MDRKSFFNSRLSIHLSVLIGKYLSPGIGYSTSAFLGGLLGNLKHLRINQALRINQYVVHGCQNTPGQLVEKSKQVLRHAGRCFYDYYHYFDKPDMIKKIVPLNGAVKNLVQISNKNQGFIVVAPHVSNFDLVMCALVRYGFQTKALAYPLPTPAYHYQNDIRKSYGLDMLSLGEPQAELEIVEYLKAGGVAFTGVDRPVPNRKRRHYVNFFGVPSPMPLGYIRLALAAKVPVVVGYTSMDPDGTYQFRHSEPLEMKQYGNRLETIQLNAERVLHKVEEYIKIAPEQWLMFYPVWPEYSTMKL
jgi:KDO2-lipid IV(A) lauroyltransferase